MSANRNKLKEAVTAMDEEALAALLDYIGDTKTRPQGKLSWLRFVAIQELKKRGLSTGKPDQPGPTTIREVERLEVEDALSFIRYQATFIQIAGHSEKPLASIEDDGFRECISHFGPFGGLFGDHLLGAVNRLDASYLRAAAAALDAIRRQVIVKTPKNKSAQKRFIGKQDAKVLHVACALDVIAKHLSGRSRLEPIKKKALRAKVETALGEEGVKPFTDPVFWAELFGRWEISRFVERDTGLGERKPRREDS